MKKRILKRENEPHIFASFERSRVTALIGARRVGKTTLLQSYMSKYPNHRWVFLNMDKRERRLRVESGELELMIEEEILQKIGQKGKIWIAIDEAQKCPELFDQVKALYDSHKGKDAIKFILTGSGHLNLHQLAAESLAGRVELMFLREFNLREVATAFHDSVSIPDYSGLQHFFDSFDVDALEELSQTHSPFHKILSETLHLHLVWGGLPEVLEEQSIQEKQRYLANYLQTYLENDIRAISSISDLDLYHHLMKACAEQTGSLRDDLRLINALGCSRATMLKYRGYLMATMQYREVFPYIHSTVKRVVKSPKGYLLNNGLISYLTGIHDFSVLDKTGLIGHRFENWVLNELLTVTDTIVASNRIDFWRTSGGSEVDFIVSIGANVLPIEVTFSSIVLPKKIRHLQEFMQREPKAKWGIYLYNGPFKIDRENRLIHLPSWML